MISERKLSRFYFYLGIYALIIDLIECVGGDNYVKNR